MFFKKTITIISLAIILTGCSSRESEIIDRDLIVFENESIPIEMLETLSRNKVVIVGEFHGVKAHKDFVTDLAIQLHRNYGFSQFITETPYAFNWIIEDYCNGNLSEMNPFLIYFYQVNFDKIQEYNLHLPKEQRLQIHGADLHHHPYFLGTSLSLLLETASLENVQILENFMQSPILKEFTGGSSEFFQEIEGLFYPEKSKKHFKLTREDYDQYITNVKGLYDNLNNNHDLYISAWGEMWYSRLIKLLEMEIKSYDYVILGGVSSDDAVREPIINEKIDEFLKSAPGKTLVNFGSNHAQKKSFRGPKIEWLGEYLQFKSPYAKGQSYSLLVVPASGKIEWRGIRNYKDISLNNPSDDLFGRIYRVSQDKKAFLSFDNEVFDTKDFILNFHFEKINTKPKSIHDGVLLLPDVEPYR